MLSVMKLGIGDGSPAAPRATASRRGTRSGSACKSCRMRKVKCNEERPKCGNCLDRKETCIYNAQRRASARARPLPPLKCHPETSIESRPLPPNPVPAPLAAPRRSKSFGSIDLISPAASYGIPNAAAEASSSQSISPDVVMTETQSACPGSSNNAEYQAAVMTADLDHNSLRRVPGLCEPLTPSQSSRSKAEEDHVSPGEDSLTSIMPLEQSSWEYHGPFSYISICSGRGIEWVNKRCSMPGFAQISRAFIQEISDTIKLQQPLSSERAPEPDQDTAWRYASLFFDHCPEADFGIIRKEDFQRRLRYHYDKTPPAPADDDDGFEWYALLNVVLAFGARIQNGTSGSSLTFLECTQAGARYFANALSKLPEMLYMKIGLVAVQAVVLMTLYVEGAGHSNIQYMLCSNALRLAQAKGMHRRPGSAWNIQPREEEVRNSIFWTIYLCDKLIAFRSGRPSAIDDDDISCEFPAHVPDCVMQQFRHAKISARIMKQLHTARAYEKPLQVVLQTASDLDKELNEWREALPTHLRLGSGDFTVTHCCTRDMHIIYLHCAYYASLIGIHSCFTQPWSPIYDKMRGSSLREQLNRSAEIVDDASRSLILLTKSAPSLHAATPLWIAMHFPLLGMINLFVRVIKGPEAAPMADVALLDVVCGHLAQLEFASSGTVTFSFAREVARISRAVMRTQQTDGRASRQSDGAQQTDYSTSPAITIQAGEPNDSWLQFEDAACLDMEDWSALIPNFSVGNSMNGFVYNDSWIPFLG